MSRKRRWRGNGDPERQDRGLVTGRGRARANEMRRAALLYGCAGTQPALCAGDSPHFTLLRGGQSPFHIPVSAWRATGRCPTTMAQWGQAPFCAGGQSPFHTLRRSVALPENGPAGTVPISQQLRRNTAGTDPSRPQGHANLCGGNPPIVMHEEPFF